MSNINELVLLEYMNPMIQQPPVNRFQHLNPYKSAHKDINRMNMEYKKAIQCHNSGDSLGFRQHYINHRQLEHKVHSDIANPNFIKGGKKVLARSQNSSNYANELKNTRWIG